MGKNKSTKSAAAAAKEWKDWESGGGQSSGGSSYTVKTCSHTGGKVVWTAEDGTTFSGARASEFRVGVADLLIDFSGNVEKSDLIAKITGPSWLTRVLKRHMKSTELLSVEWRDMTAPRHLSADFWIDLRAALRPGSRVTLSCIGSHGRTGTGLAALWIAEQFLAGRQATAAEAVAMVRKKHCVHACETATQEYYLAALAAALAKRLDPSVNEADLLAADKQALDKMFASKPSKSIVSAASGKEKELLLDFDYDKGSSTKASTTGLLDDPTTGDDDAEVIVIGDPEKMPRVKLTGNLEAVDPTPGVIFTDDANWEWLYLPDGDGKGGTWVELDSVEFIDPDDMKHEDAVEWCKGKRVIRADGMGN